MSNIHRLKSKLSVVVNIGGETFFADRQSKGDVSQALLEIFLEIIKMMREGKSKKKRKKKDKQMDIEDVIK